MKFSSPTKVQETSIDNSSLYTEIYENRPITEHDPKFISAMLKEEFSLYNQEEKLFGDQEKTTFFAQNAKLNDQAMVEYGLMKDNMSFSGRRNTEISEHLHNENFIFEQNQEYLERFDSRGKKMKIRRGQITQPGLERIGYSFATINFHPSTLITQ